jgi:hypothetical protein
MALTLVKEDGSGKVDANAYADVADGDAYHEGHCYDEEWTSLDAPKKAVALVMATRLIDAEYQFGGVRATISQALQWPRSDCHDPDGGTAGFGTHNAARVAARGVNPDGGDLIRLLNAEWTIPSDLVPKSVVEATCELARELAIVDRTAAPEGEGLKYYNDGSVQKGYDKADKRPVIPIVVQAMLTKYGTLVRARSGAVRMTRA